MDTALANLIDAFQVLPGIGRRSAERFSLSLLRDAREGGRALSAALMTALNEVQFCERCRNYTTNPICDYCLDDTRDARTVCVVQGVPDLWAMEEGGHYNGRYFVLHGLLSPLEGIGAEALGRDMLTARLDEGVEELVLALPFSVDGEATVLWIQSLAAPYIEQGLRITRLAQGLPVGGKISHMDNLTLNQALSARQRV